MSTEQYIVPYVLCGRTVDGLCAQDAPTSHRFKGGVAGLVAYLRKDRGWVVVPYSVYLQNFIWFRFPTFFRC